MAYVYPSAKRLVMLIGMIPLLSVSLSACDGTYKGFDVKSTGGRHNFWTPEPAFLGDLPDGDDGYSVGFRNGCNTALGAMSSGMSQGLPFEYDPNRGIVDRDYYEGYRTGFRYCMVFLDASPL